MDLLKRCKDLIQALHEPNLSMTLHETLSTELYAATMEIGERMPERVLSWDANGNAVAVRID